MINRDQFVCFRQSADSIPVLGDKKVYLTKFHVADAQVNHSWRWLLHKNPVGKVAIFCDDGQVTLASIFPNFSIGHFIVNIALVQKIRRLPSLKAIRKIDIKKIKGHGSSSSEGFHQIAVLHKRCRESKASVYILRFERWVLPQNFFATLSHAQKFKNCLHRDALSAYRGLAVANLFVYGNAVGQIHFLIIFWTKIMHFTDTP